MLLAAVVLVNKLRWMFPAAVMVVPFPLLYGSSLSLQIFKYVIPSSVNEYLDMCIASSIQKAILTFFSNINGTQVYKLIS